MIGGAVVNAVNRVPWRAFQPVINRIPTWNEVGINRLDPFTGNQTQRCIARCGDKIKAALIHQGDHFIGCIGGFDLDHTSGFFFKGCDPVKCGIGFAAFDITRPSDDIDFALGGSQFCHHVGSRSRGCNKGKHNRRGCAGFQ